MVTNTGHVEKNLCWLVQFGLVWFGRFKFVIWYLGFRDHEIAMMYEKVPIIVWAYPIHRAKKSFHGWANLIHGAKESFHAWANLIHRAKKSFHVWAYLIHRAKKSFHAWAMLIKKALCMRYIINLWFTLIVEKILKNSHTMRYVHTWNTIILWACVHMLASSTEQRDYQNSFFLVCPAHYVPPPAFPLFFASLPAAKIPQQHRQCPTSAKTCEQAALLKSWGSKVDF